MGVLVDLIPAVTLALEAADGVHTGSVLAGARHQRTLVYLRHAAGDGVYHESGATKSAQVSVVWGTFVGTLLAGQSPGRAHRAAANHPGLGPAHCRQAGTVYVLHEAVLLPHVNALPSVRGQHICRRTLAFIAAFCIDTPPRRTQVGAFLALIHVNTHLVVIVQPEAGLAGAHETAEGVAAPAVVAEVDEVRALVDVLQDHGLLVGLKATPAGTYDLRSRRH